MNDPSSYLPTLLFAPWPMPSTAELRALQDQLRSVDSIGPLSAPVPPTLQVLATQSLLGALAAQGSPYSSQGMVSAPHALPSANASTYEPPLNPLMQADPAGYLGGASLYARSGDSSPNRSHWTGAAGLAPQEFNAGNFAAGLTYPIAGEQTTPPPPENIPGGPWKWSADPRNECNGTFIGQNGFMANWDEKDGHWDVWDRQRRRQRYNRHGAPISAEEAHAPYRGPRRIPFLRWPGLPLIVDPCFLDPSLCFPDDRT